MTSSTPPDPKLYRRVMGQFATGVTVILTQVDEEIHGMTANAVTSLSLDPLLLILGVDKKAHMAEMLQRAGVFTVNILRDDQEPLSRYFAGGARRGMAKPEFHFVPWGRAPRLGGCLASLACQVDGILEGGDHWIVVGRVTDLYEGPPPHHPMIFYAGRYRQLDPAHADPAPELETSPIPVHIFYDAWGDDIS
ncbi:MAG: flavin reductase [Anaerolineae bacterium]|nr:flavin reductase [Anaerolineae bacterium]